MTSAWIITRESSSSSAIEVVAILSARKSFEQACEFIEALYVLLHGGAQEQLDIAHYVKPSVSYPAMQISKHTKTAASCGANPNLVVRKASKIEIVEPLAEVPIIEWKDPDRIVEIDNSGPSIAQKKTGEKRKAAFVGPLRAVHSKL